jgi:hypothetical protein
LSYWKAEVEDREAECDMWALVINILVRKSGERFTVKKCDIVAYQKMPFPVILSQSSFATTQEQYQKLVLKLAEV